MGSFEYWERASLWESGRIDKTNSFKTHVNMYNLPIRELYDTIWELTR